MIARRKKRPAYRIGKVSGTVHLSGAAMTALRCACWVRDQGICQKCGVSTYLEARFDGDPQAFDLAHQTAQGAGGGDVLSNVQCECHRCHMRKHSGNFGTVIHN